MIQAPGDNLRVVWAEFSTLSYSFASYQHKCVEFVQPFLELKTQHRDHPIGWSLSMHWPYLPWLPWTLRHMWPRWPRLV